MRGVPMTVWASDILIERSYFENDDPNGEILSKKVYEDFETAIIADASFTHMHQTVHHIQTAYALAIKSLIENEGKANKAEIAYQDVLDYAM